jgi:GntR family transcriptional regulator, transcriptional repressor for pyruvate dehydrogenase complex
MSATAAGPSDTRSDETYRRLREYIERGGATEGTRLPSESEFADRLGVSRASIREALARLRAEGRTVSRRGSGTFVARPVKTELVRLSAIESIGDVIDWHEFRLAIEGEIAALAAERRSTPDLAQMQKTQAALLAKLALAVGAREDAAFHHAVATGSHNQKLIEASKALTSHIFRWAEVSRKHVVLTLAERREIIANEHGEIIAAIAAQNPHDARQAARRHLLNGRARLLSSLDR